MKFSALLIFIFNLISLHVFSQVETKEFFDEKDKLFFNGTGFSKFDNLNGNLAWGESYMLMSYFSMYESTGDISYLKKIAKRSYLLIEKNDLNVQKKDFRGDLRPLWLSTRYSKNEEPIAWVVHTGMITYPILLFCHEILRNQNLHQENGINEKSLLKDAKILLKQVQIILDSHDDEWNNVIGNYVFSQDFPLEANILIGEVLPFNMFSAMGRSQLMMYKITGEDKYKIKTVLMAEYFKNELQLHDGSYIWQYHPKVNRYEDISHGQIEVQFAYLCFKEGIVFTRRDMKRFSNTFLNNIYIEKGKVADRIFYSIEETVKFNNYLNAVSGWMFLSEFNSKIFPLVSEIIDYQVDQNNVISNGNLFFGIAERGKYENNLTLKISFFQKLRLFIINL